MWDKVEVRSVAEGYALCIKEKPLHNWSGTPLVVPYAMLADAMAEEWRRQPKQLNKNDMPLTGLTSFVHEQVVPQRETRINELMAVLETEALCYRLDEPVELAARQQAAWEPWLEWAERFWGAKPLSTTGILAIEQPAALLEKAAVWLEAQPDFRLAVLHQAVSTLGSFILGAACIEKVVSADEAHAIAFLEEHFQREQWGEDTLATERLEAIRQSLRQLATFTGLLR